tara:strand:- start:508 stop:1125 length:618 start_codon:yes stop_codon:yes gene_type:complete
MTAKIKLNHSGGNGVSLNAPASNPASSDIAFKLPVADGSAGQFMKTDGSGNLSFDAAGGGKILQVVSAVATSTVSSADSAQVDTGLSASITPSATNSKVLVIVSQSMMVRRTGGNGWAAINYDLVRGSTVIMDGVDNIALRASSHSPYTLVAAMVNCNFLDSPSTTSATTYKTMAGRGNSGDSNMNWKAQDNSSPSTITLLEVAG